MRRLLISGFAIGLAGFLSPAAMAGDSAAPSANRVMTRPMSAPMSARGHVSDDGFHHWGSAGRWQGSNRPTGGWTSYRRAPVGYILPRYWIQPTFYIANYSNYGLPVPQSGYGWSRYYDDAVLTDRYGRVYDSRSDVRWDSDDRAEGRQLPYEFDGYGDTGVTYNGGFGNGSVGGRWVGTWYGDDGRVYSGEYRGSYQGDTATARQPEGYYRSDRGAGYDASRHHGHMHWSDESMTPYRYGEGYSSAYGYYGYGAPVIITTTVVSQPVVTTTIEEETIYTPAPVRRAHKVRARPRRAICSCGS
ncbi:MAG: RcnB family protein [Sphingobium sp.]